MDGRRNVVDFTSFIRAFQSVENEELNYFLVEKRYFKMIKEPFTKEVNGKKIGYIYLVSLIKKLENQ